VSRGKIKMKSKKDSKKQIDLVKQFNKSLADVKEGRIRRVA
jgi:hypothetical protein